ncbi:MAG: aminotransferase class I/II-fold pyridoxal phosphate-dependent enzyme [Bacteroidales bacterium]|nr:aminotransferase class I/II-fold pyridoxal phosphate-dependent enzyme [Bacteroidales bacterium]MCF8404907.1 aminotransferase class I/II-fold pyridoxal phosphate-dependent enzyme [Bacteroidales bacterium]
MLNNSEFRKQAHQFVDWMADFLENIEELPVKSQVMPGEIIDQLPISPPLEPESMDTIFHDFQKIILPGITHWQSPNFFAYFPANSSYPSLLAEMLTATLGAQCMVWETSPAAAELEELVLNWIKKMIGIPENFHGVIQDTASTATLTALLTAREKISSYRINEKGFDDKKFRVYCSSETHSSIEKGVKIAGLGKENLVKIEVDENFAIQTEKLEKAIIEDIQNGYIPVCIIASIGTTGSTAIDPLKPLGEIAAKYKIWLHVDAAFAGTALILDEYKWMIEGIEQADSFVFNPHKWMFTNFDCSAYYVKDKDALLNTFSINPEYLRTKTAGQVNDYRDWGIQLGRRFRALKLWFVIRNYGINGLQEKIREHISLAKEFELWVDENEDFELITPRTLSLVCFRYNPSGIKNEEAINQMNEKLLHSINSQGKMFLSHTRLNGKYTLRMVFGQTNVERKHVSRAIKIIGQTSKMI